MNAIMLMEPSSAQMRRFAANRLREPLGMGPSNVIEIKKRLRTLRTTALENIDRSLECLKAIEKKRTSRRWFYAKSAADAVSIIGDLSPQTKAVAVNKSAVMTGEVAPLLVRAGMPVIEPYYDGLSETEVRFSEYWQLPAIPMDMRFTAFDCREDLGKERQRHLTENGARNLTAVIGVNALSAEDGGAVLLQHRQNIGRMLRECREIFLIATIDKILPTMEDAVFQTRCMAGFGSDALALGLGMQTVSADSLESYPFMRPAEDISDRVNVIVLDNGRRDLLHTEYRTILHCIGCRACMTQCPGSRYFRNKTLLSPRELLFGGLLKKDASLDRCLQCLNCRTACPVDIDLPGMILTLRTRRRRLLPALSDILLSSAELTERMGSLLAPVANGLLKNKWVKQISQITCGIESRRNLPLFAAKTFEEHCRDLSSGSES